MRCVSLLSERAQPNEGVQELAEIAILGSATRRPEPAHRFVAALVPDVQTRRARGTHPRLVQDADRVSPVELPVLVQQHRRATCFLNYIYFLCEFKSKVVSHFEWAALLFLLAFLLLLNEVLFVGLLDLLSVEVLELVVFGHEAGQLQGEGLDHACVLEHFDESLGVLLQLLGLELLIDVQILDAVLQRLYYFESFGVLALLV